MQETCNLSLDQWNDLLPQQNPIIKLTNSQYVALTDPYSSMYEGGTFESGAGEQIINIVPSNPVTNQSLVTPNAQEWVLNSCAVPTVASQWGNFQFTTVPQFYWGLSPQVCVSVAYPKVIDNYTKAVDTMKKGIAELKRSDGRYQFAQNSGLKFVASIGASIANNLAGYVNSIATPFPFANIVGGLPTSYLTWKMVLAIMNNYRTAIRNVDYFAGGLFSLIIGADAMEIIRNDAQLHEEVTDAVRGGFKDAKEALWDYAFQKYTYRGFQMTWDEEPLRFAVVSNGTQKDTNGNTVPSGWPVYIEPRVIVNSSYGKSTQPNPAWLSAPYEVALLFTQGTFKWLMPQQYQGEGDMKFPAQYYSGESVWLNVKNDCNPFQDHGYFVWRVVRAVQADKPHGVCAIAYMRCQQDLNGATCSDITTGLSA